MIVKSPSLPVFAVFSKALPGKTCSNLFHIAAIAFIHFLSDSNLLELLELNVYVGHPMIVFGLEMSLPHPVNRPLVRDAGTASAPATASPCPHWFPHLSAKRSSKKKVTTLSFSVPPKTLYRNNFSLFISRHPFPPFNTTLHI